MAAATASVYFGATGAVRGWNLQINVGRPGYAFVLGRYFGFAGNLPFCLPMRVGKRRAVVPFFLQSGPGGWAPAIPRQNLG